MSDPTPDMDITEYCGEFPKNFLAQLVYNEVGEALWAQLEEQGCQFMFSDSLEEHWFTNITPALQAAVDKKKQEALASLKPEEE